MGGLAQCRVQDMALLTSKAICQGRSTAGSSLDQLLLNLDTSQEHGKRSRQIRYVNRLNAGSLPSGLQDRNTCIPSPLA